MRDMSEKSSGITKTKTITKLKIYAKNFVSTWSTTELGERCSQAICYKLNDRKSKLTENGFPTVRNWCANGMDCGDAKARQRARHPAFHVSSDGDGVCVCVWQMARRILYTNIWRPRDVATHTCKWMVERLCAGHFPFSHCIQSTKYANRDFFRSYMCATHCRCVRVCLQRNL